MIYPGTCSITLANLSRREVVDYCRRAGLAGIEWWGKAHVPPGDIAAAREAAQLTRKAGLQVSSYGSYYYAGVSENDGLKFSGIVDTAIALGAPVIRVWAGNKASADADADFFRRVADDLLRIGDMSAKAGIAVTIEYHGGTLTDDNCSAVSLMEAVKHPAVFFSWQPPSGMNEKDCLAGLKNILPRLGSIHVFHWQTGKPAVRLPLADGFSRWQKYLSSVAADSQDYWALLEFVKNDDPEQFLADAAVLNMLLNKKIDRGSQI
ncbi:MAG: sugar phosphate isomerase/epimerase [Victivallales bacterium]|nr:sugar phosphate isomerase/epimerase [Victivallales bacterium]